MELRFHPLFEFLIILIMPGEQRLFCELPLRSS